jgi:uncharacterized protein DUF5672
MVAVVVPIPSTGALTADEEISLRHAEHFLGGYEKFFLVPESVRFERPGFGVMKFADEFFGSSIAHSRLQLSKDFYTRFQRYKYILMYHLDALVFSDQLTEWCQTDLDYIAPPWIQCEDSPWVTRSRVGNGGFALLKIESFLEVMRSRRLAEDPDEYWSRFSAGKPWYQRAINMPRKFIKRHYAFNGVRHEMAKWTTRTDGKANSDYFWSDEAIKYLPTFRIASVETGLRFAFEVAPRMCFRMNNNQLPFGCHAWARYDRAFWEPYLLK